MYIKSIYIPDNIIPRYDVLYTSGIYAYILFSCPDHLYIFLVEVGIYIYIYYTSHVNNEGVIVLVPRPPLYFFSWNLENTAY